MTFEVNDFTNDNVVISTRMKRRYLARECGKRALNQGHPMRVHKAITLINSVL